MPFASPPNVGVGTRPTAKQQARPFPTSGPLRLMHVSICTYTKARPTGVADRAYLFVYPPRQPPLDTPYPAPFLRLPGRGRKEEKEEEENHMYPLPGGPQSWSFPLLAEQGGGCRLHYKAPLVYYRHRQIVHIGGIPSFLALRSPKLLTCEELRVLTFGTQRSPPAVISGPGDFFGAPPYKVNEQQAAAASRQSDYIIRSHHPACIIIPRKEHSNPPHQHSALRSCRLRYIHTYIYPPLTRTALTFPHGRGSFAPRLTPRIRSLALTSTSSSSRPRFTC